MIRGISNRRKYNAPQRRQDLADAAIQVLGNYGARGLTHAKVDEHAGLPDGTTSYYFRTRGALQLAIIDRLNELDTGALAMMSELAHDDKFGYSGTLGIARLVMLSGTEPWLTRSRARFELILETRRNADIAAKIVDYGQHFYALTRDVIVQWHPPVPAPDLGLIHEQTAMILTLINGIMLSYVAGSPLSPTPTSSTVISRVCCAASRSLRPTSHDRGADPVYPTVCTIRMSTLALRATVSGTDPNRRPATVPSPKLPTTSKSAFTSSAKWTSAVTGAPTIACSSMSRAPAAFARPRAS